MCDIVCPSWRMLPAILLLLLVLPCEPVAAQKMEVRVCTRDLPRNVDYVSLAIAISRHSFEVFTGSYDVWGWVRLRGGQCEVVSRGNTVRRFLPPYGSVYIFAVARDAAGTLRRVPLGVGREDHVGPTDKRFCIREAAFNRVVERQRIGRNCPDDYQAVNFPLRFSRKIESTWDLDIDRSWLTFTFTLDDPRLAEPVGGNAAAASPPTRADPQLPGSPGTRCQLSEQLLVVNDREDILTHGSGGRTAYVAEFYRRRDGAWQRALRVDKRADLSDVDRIGSVGRIGECFTLRLTCAGDRRCFSSDEHFITAHFASREGAEEARARLQTIIGGG